MDQIIPFPLWEIKQRYLLKGPMTLGASESQQASRDELFSRKLFEHAVVGELQELMPVGAWTQAQGIRRGHTNRFFYDLRPDGFLPLGPNHPAALAASIDAAPLAAISFPADLVRLHPWLAGWHWTIRPGTETGDTTLIYEHGWDFFSTARASAWSLPLGDGYEFVASPEALPAPVHSMHHGWLRVFLTVDMLGPAGRLPETRKWLHAHIADGQWRGHVWRLQAAPQAVAALAAAGLAVGHDGDALVLSFPTSFSPADALAVAAMARGARG